MDTEPDTFDAGRAGGFEKVLKLSKREAVVAAMIGVLVVLAFCRGQFTTLCEYPAIYNGARLAGTPYLYDTVRNQQEQMREIGATRPSLSYGRLPFYAALVWPLGLVPYQKSLIAWEVCSGIALVSFVILWPVTRRQMTVLACAWSVPAALVFLFAQDDFFLLVVLAMLFRWHDSRPLASGLLATLLSIKFHLFLLLPLFLIAQRRWWMGLGFLLGCTTLVVMSFAVGGAAWPAQMARVLSSREILTREYVMPNIRGLLSAFTDRITPEILLSLVVGGFVFRIVQRADFRIGMAAVLVGSLLVSHHAGPEDCVVLIPALLVLGEGSQSGLAVYCLILLSPVVYAFLSFGGFLSALTVLAIGSILVVLYRQLFLLRAPLPATGTG
jgi:hypothetical protein